MNNYAEYARRQRQIERSNRLADKRERKRLEREARREARTEAHLGHVVDADPTEGMAQPPMLGTVARIVGEI